MTLYFITNKESETGLKFDLIEKKMNQILKRQKAISKNIGFKQWRDSRCAVSGGFSSIVFKEEPNRKVWSKISENEYLPKRSSKAGREIWEQLNSVGMVENQELNDCIGFKRNTFHSIGFAMDNHYFFGFEINDEWGIKIPKDCEEVTGSAYKNLFKIK